MPARAKASPITCCTLLVALLVFGLACDGTRPQAAAVRDEKRADCISCHARDYRAVHEPVHMGVRPDRCAACHLQTAWSPAELVHAWPLTGAHAQAACFACHVGTPPVFEQTPGDCVACHRADYEKSRYPGHDKFALTCADCHSTTAFHPARPPRADGALTDGKTKGSQAGGKIHHRAVSSPPKTSTADPAPATAEPPATAPLAPPHAERVHPETQFPIAAGAHSGIGCQTCHDQGGVMGKGNTDCTQCHKRSRFDGKHQGVRDYPLGDAPANFCVECHTRGRARF